MQPSAHASVSIEDDEGGYRLGVELHAHLPGIDLPEVERIVMTAAHETCPYSKALRGDATVDAARRPDERSRGESLSRAARGFLKDCKTPPGQPKPRGVTYESSQHPF